MTTDLVWSSAIDLAAAIQAGEVSAVEVLDAHLAQIEHHNPAINAVVIIDAEGARTRAAEADAARARGERWGALHGVPFTVKDAHETRGLRTTVGFPPFADYVSAHDSTVVARLRAAGAILVGKTNVPTMLGDFQTENPLFGRTSNPWNFAYTSGGSSGGAAAAVAAGMTPFEVGTDLSSSIRLPAHFCGIYGLKPTEHRVPLTGLIPNPQQSPRAVRIMSCIGPMARTASDLALVYSLIAGPDGHDTDVPPMPVTSAAALDWSRLRVAVAPTMPPMPTSTAVRAALADLGRQMETMGAHVGEPTLPMEHFENDLEGLGDLIGLMLGAFEEQDQAPATVADYLRALDQRDASITAWERFFDDWDVLVCPAAMTSAFTHREAGSPIAVDGVDEMYWSISGHGAVFNYSGHPAIVIPRTLDQDSLPIGVQIVARRWNEALLLTLAAALETERGFQRPPL